MTLICAAPRTVCFSFIAACLLSASSTPAAGAESSRKIDAQRIAEIAKLLPAQPAGMGRPLADRAAWKKLAALPAWKRVVGDAEKLLKAPLPEQPDELYLDFSKTGNRTRWQRVASQRRGRVDTLVLAECLENKGRFLPAFVALVKALDKEKTWVMPAHDRGLSNFNQKIVDIDLGSSGLAWELAQAHYLLGDKLDPATRRLIADNLERRILAPYRDMVTGKRKENWWMLGTNNWNAVCLAGVTGCALTLSEARDDRAFFVAAAEHYSRYFLKGFTADGYCSEGVGYWNYGYGHYLMLAEMIHQAPGGKVDLLQSDVARAAGTYASRIEIADGAYPSFADCSITAKPSPTYMHYISRRFALGQRRWEAIDPVSPGDGLSGSMIFSFPNSATKTPVAPNAAPALGPRDWFADAGILICRPAPDAPKNALAVALKGGHNAEHHNHNDVGSYIAVVNGAALLVDPGAETYTARTFSSKRYDSKVLNSFGHPVPLVAGKLQSTGRKAEGRVLQTGFNNVGDTVEIDLRPAYAVNELKTLKRTFNYIRMSVYQKSSSFLGIPVESVSSSQPIPGTLVVTDEVEFTAPQTFGIALVTFGKWRQIEKNVLEISDRGETLLVLIDTKGQDYELKAEEIHEDTRRMPIRLGINLKQPVTRATITVTISPKPQAENQ